MHLFTHMGSLVKQRDYLAYHIKLQLYKNKKKIRLGKFTGSILI